MKQVTNIPIIGYFVRLCIFAIKLPVKFDELYDLSQRNKESIDKFIKNTKIVEDQIVEVKNNTSASLIGLNNRINSINNSLNKKIILKNSKNNTESKYFADNHLLDDFYLEFENKFRGPEEQITERLEEYLPLFKKVKTQSNKSPILDIGCGRGEFLSLMKLKKINTIGIDINESMVVECKKKGFDAIEGDAIEYLSKSKPQSFSAITGFHIVEHIEFSDLLNLFSATYKAITDNGFVLFETPNPENLYVGAHTFYFDPSHIKPIPPQLLKFAMETVGFSEVEIMYLHPEKVQSADDENIDPEIYTRLFGPRDYAVIAKK